MFTYLFYLLILQRLMCAYNVCAGLNPNKVCNSLYYGEQEKNMINSQTRRTKIVLENMYKRRAMQSGMTFEQVKLCYENKKKSSKPQMPLKTISL
jgi:hypothetical protein